MKRRRTRRSILIVLVVLLFIVVVLTLGTIVSVDASSSAGDSDNNHDDNSSSSPPSSSRRLLLDDETSSRHRAMSTLGKVSTHPSDDSIVIRRAVYPQQPSQNSQQDDNGGPHICLAFLSCCDRIDLLNHTLYGAIRHMEEDEPTTSGLLRYEIAWVDNGSSKQLTDQIQSTYQIEHALTLSHNMGLAYGMNLLIHNLCTAPYILLLEEDWLYLDELVAPQTIQRKRSITTSIALVEHLQRNNIQSFDTRSIMGVFLRHESYDSFLRFPYADIWESQSNVNLQSELQHALHSQMAKTNGDDVTTCEAQNHGTCKDIVDDDEKLSNLVVDIDYRIFCGDVGFGQEALWGSYTNGAGLYRRSDLIKIGRMYGEPGDSFHDRYTEGNFAYRVALHNCHATIRLTDDKTCDRIHDPECTGAFHHIGGGRGTRPRTAKDTKCDDITWNFLGTPMFDKYRTQMARITTGRKDADAAVDDICSPTELQELRDRKFRDVDSEAYREEVKKEAEAVFEEEARERQQLKEQAAMILQLLQNDEQVLRDNIPWMKDMPVSEIRSMATRMQRLADSPHPLQGYFDMHGRKLEKE